MDINPDLRNNTLALQELADSGLKCCPCTDNAIAEDTPIGDVAAAVTLAPSMQTFTMQGQQITAPCTIPVCLDCRKRQLGFVSKAGLITA